MATLLLCYLVVTASHHCVCSQMLQVLREKAENRNPDEYYTAMQHGPQRVANPDAGCVLFGSHELS
jgi:Utp11 protein